MASITQIGNKYRALVRRKGVTKCKTFSTKREAAAWASVTEASILQKDAHGLSTPKAATVSDLIDQFIAAEQSKNEATQSILRVMRKEIGFHRLSNLSQQVVQNWVDTRMKKCSPTTVAVYLSTAGRVFKWARTVRQIDVPVEIWLQARTNLRYAGHRVKSRPREIIPTAQQIDQLIEYYDGLTGHATLPMQDIVRFAASNAMRRSEICRIQAKHVDLENKTILITARKHPTAPRDQVIPIVDRVALEILTRRRKDCRTSDSRLFPVAPRSVSKSFTKAVQACGFDFVFHSLRAYAITNLLRQNLSIPQVAVISGHQDWSSMRRYSKLTAGDLRPVLDSLAAE